MTYASILVPVDLDSEEFLRLIEKASALISTETKVHLVHVGSIMAALFPVSGMGARQDPDDLDAFQKEYNSEIKAFLAQLAQKSPVPVDSTHVALGKISSEVLDLADKLACDLIVIGRHSRKSHERLLGSNANAILRSATCDVLTIAI